jgi:hypothetical protein
VAKRKSRPKGRKKDQRADGKGLWGGSKRVVTREVDPIVERHGIRRTSGKRRETFGNPSSDHFVGNLTAFARDYATANNHDLKNKIGRKLGIVKKGESVQDYKAYYLRRGGRRFRIQLIAATHGTGPHLHIGVRRV